MDATISELDDLLAHCDWNGLVLDDLERFISVSEAIPSALVALDLGLAATLSTSLDLIGWLKTLPDDNDFMSALEMAMGRSEMECPVELWDAGDGANTGGHFSGGGLGRVSEQKLSWLRNVRSYLHPVIYHNHDFFMSAADLMTKLDLLPPLPSTLVDDLQKCARLALPFAELLSGDSESSAPNRLLQLQLPKAQVNSSNG